MEQTIKKILHDCCITATCAIKETGLSRNAFYLFQDKNYPAYENFIEAHKSDFVFTSDVFLSAFQKSGLTQLELSDKLDIHNVTLNLLLNGKKRPSRASGDYDKIRIFCSGGCELGRIESECSLSGVFGGCNKCRHML